MALTLVLAACGAESGDGTSSLVRMKQVQDPICQYGATQIDTGLDANGNGTLEDEEVNNSSLICQAQSGVSEDEFALSAKGQVAGTLDLSLIPTPKQSSDLSPQARSLSSTASARKVTSQAGTLWLTPNEIASAIKADQAALAQANSNAGSNTQIAPPVIEPIEIPVAADGSYSIDVPAGTDYSLSYVSADATRAVKIEDVNVSPNQTTDVSIAQLDLALSGNLNFVVQDAISHSPIENATTTLLSDGTSSASSAAGAVSFEGLAAGSYLVLIEQSGYVSQTLSVDITAGQTLDFGVVEISNDSGSASGTVTVDTELLTGLDNIVVYARDAHGGIYSTLTNASGAFMFAALPVDSGYSFIAQANDFSADKIDNITINAGANSDIGSIELIPSSAFVGSITGFAKFEDKLSVLNAHAGLLVAIEGTDKEAVTSRDGAFVLNGLAPGRYTLNFTDSNYQTTTIENVRVVATATTSLDPVNLKLKTGQVSGVVSLEGQLSSAGILVEILGSTSKTYTDNSGRWFLNLPTGNYGNGIRYSANLFESKTANETISVIENGEYQAAAQVLAQTGKRLSLDLSANGGVCSVLQVALQGTSGEANGYTALFSVEGGKLEQDLVFGDYNLTATCVDDGFESVVKTLSIAAGNGLVLALDPIALRVSFVTINSGAPYTNDANITLAIGAVGASEMQVTQGSFDSGWIPLAESYALSLDADDGIKTVLIHLRDDAQQPLSDVSTSIELDTTISVASFTATGATTKNDVLHLRLDLSAETGATVTADIPGLVAGLLVFDNGLNGDVSANDGVYERDLDITTPNEITAAITANITDRAGNTATQNAASGIVLSTNPSISAVSVSSNVASGEMTIRFSTDEPATSNINYGTDAAALNTNLPVEALLTQNHTVTLTNLPANQLTFFELLATDNATNVGTFNGQGKLAPAPISGLNAAAGSAEVGLVWSESTHNELQGYNIYRSADGGSSFNLLSGTIISERYTVDSTPSNEVTYQYYVTVVDTDGNESVPSASVTVTPSSNLAGPTEMNGGVIANNTIWLSSRSPYNISNNMLIREEGTLLLMAGTQVQFAGSQKHILVNGSISAYGTAENKVLITSDNASNEYQDQSAIVYGKSIDPVTFEDSPNPLVSVFNYSTFNYVNVYYDSEHLNSRAQLINIDVNNSEVKIRPNSLDTENTDFAVRSLKDSILTIDECTRITHRAAFISQVIRSEIKMADGVICSRDTTGYSEQAALDYLGYGLRSSRVTDSHADAVNLQVTESITGGTFTDLTVYAGNANALNVKSTEFVNSKIAITGNESFLNLTLSKLDSTSTVSALYLNVALNYWGTTDLDNIAQRTGYIPSPVRKTHLYPIITGSDFNTADWDNDGIPDLRDHDNDNDGYSDLQEDWGSDPVYGSIFSPLDSSSHPVVANDSDMDGIPDSTDTDDDNDNLLDSEEVTYGTNPLLADTDADGSLDGDEISRKYDPLDGSNYPYLGTVSDVTIDGTNVNADGVVYFAGTQVTLNSVTVLPGVKLMVDRETRLTLNDVNLIANQNNPIFMRSSGSGSGEVHFNSGLMSYANIKLDIQFHTDVDSRLMRSDLSLSHYQISGVVIDSLLISSSNGYIHAGGVMTHNYVVMSTSDLYNRGRFEEARIIGIMNGDTSSTVRDSVIDTYNSQGAITDSIVTGLYSNTLKVTNSDVRFTDYDLGSAITFFEGSYLSTPDGSAFYDGLGTPSDILSDGAAETEFTLGAYTYKVDGIKNPRSTPNFPNGESDVWDPSGVGCLWDKNDSSTFPDPLAL